MENNRVTRRDFLKGTGAIGVGGAVSLGIALPEVLAAETPGSVDLSQAPAVDPKQLVAALADTIMPTASGYPGYKRLEQYGITDEVMKGLSGIAAEEFNVFNAAAREFFPKAFVELNENDRTAFLELVADSFAPDTWGVGSGKKSKGPDSQLHAKVAKEAVDKIQKVFRLTRARAMTVFYQNFPEHKIARDKNMFPILAPGDTHQIINPNTSKVVTGWDVANFPGPLSWQEEEARRAKWMKIHWHND